MMSEAVVTFQSQLSGVMETVFKAAMYEITRLVEDSFLEEVSRSREQVETLKRRLKLSESRRKDRPRGDGDRAGSRCVDCGRVGVSTAEEGGEISDIQTQTGGDHKLKQEGVVKEIHSCRGIAREMAELGQDTNSSVKSPGIGNEKLNRLLKEEVLNITSDSTELQGKWHVNLDGEEESNLSGPSTGLNDHEIRQCPDEWDTGLDQRPDPSLVGNATDPSEPLYRSRCGMEDLGGFDKTGYGSGHMFDMSSLEGLQESPPRLAEELTYMGHYQGDLGASDGTVHRSHQPGPNRSRRGALGSPADPPSRANMDVDREFSCLLINEDGYLQDPSVLYPEHMSGETVSRASLRGQGGHIGDTSLQNTDVYNPSETYSLTLNLEERLQHQTGARAGRRHNCNQCSMSFSDSASLKAHKHTHKAGQGPPYSCNQCGKAFTQACNLKVHQRIHAGQGLHLCSHCGKGFPSFADLKSHKCSQTGDKPYCCSVCGNKFSRLWNLKLHRRIHTQEKPHQCSMCDKSFTRADILKVHQRTHTGERPYCCSICGLSFKRLDHLKSHQRKHRPVCKPEEGWGDIGLVKSQNFGSE